MKQTLAANYFALTLSPISARARTCTHMHTHACSLVQTPDGMEQTLAINFFSHALLTLGLLDKMNRGG